jgi:shikimate kinase
MGVGKSSIGRRLAGALNLPFKDADAEIEAAAGASVADIFATLGEPAFRAGERRVIARLLEGPPHVLATGGGAFCQDETRALLKAKSTTVWLKADLEVLARRVARKSTRPLLTGRDPMEVLTAQAQTRYPLYAEAELVVETGEGPHQGVVDQVLAALGRLPPRPAPGDAA